MVMDQALQDNLQKEYFPTCYLIGDGNLLLECAKILLANHFLILGVISPSSKIEIWASEKGISYFHSLVEAKASLLSTPFDYLFSIVNAELISADILRCARQFPINYHDAPLPRYAGVHATSWAILNDEIMHGVSWHVMTECIDAGDILKQAFLSVMPDETALSLNTRCLEQALYAFSALASELADGIYSRSPQDLTKRTYYAANQKPPDNAWVDWRATAEEIERLCRALQFGDYKNELSVPKFVLGGRGFVIDKLMVLQECSNKLPGTVVKVTSEYFQVATSSYDLAILQVSTLAGQVCSVGNLVEAGVILPLLAPHLYRKFYELSVKNSKYEFNWVKELSKFNPTSLSRIPAQAGVFNIESLPNALYQRALTWVGDKEKLPVFLLAIWLIYLYRLEGQAQIGVLLDIPSLRALPDELRVFFATKIPFSFAISGEESFAELFKRVQGKYELVTSKGTYLYDVTRRYPELVDLPFIEAACSIKMADQIFAKEDFLSPDSITEHFLILLDSLLAKPEQPISHASLLTEVERKQILVEWNATSRPYPQDKTIHQLFEEQVEETPNNVALVYEGIRLTYAELNAQANQLAHYLIEHHQVQPDDLIALCLDRSQYMLIAILAVLKSGGAYVPLDPSYPNERISYMLENSGAKVILTNEIYQDKINHLAKEICALPIDSQKMMARLVNQVIENPITATGSDHLAYVIYTSGTTGVPKGVMIEHKGVVNLCFAERDELGLSASGYKNCLWFANYVFDAHVWELFPVILNGHSSYILSNVSRQDISLLSEYIASNGIFIATLPPALLDREHVLKLKKLVVAGDKSDDALLKDYIQRGVDVINAYGPTEVTVCATLNHCKAADESGNIGRPIPNTMCYVLDSHLAPVPVGVIGELYIGGVGLARGYLNKPKLTKESFITDLFQVENKFLEGGGGRLYKTGDFVRWFPNGSLEYIGRNDFQVKIRGYRVELGDIESKLKAYPGIQQAVVLAKEQNIDGDNKASEKYLIAYYVAPHVLDETEIQGYLAKNLPEYMLPNILVYLESLPLNTSGKLDRKALPDPKIMKEDNYVPPTNKREQLVCEMFAKVLRLPKVGIRDDFFSLGGTSIKAITLVTNLQTNFKISVSDVFSLRTSRKIAKHVTFAKDNLRKQLEKIKVAFSKVRHESTLNKQQVGKLDAYVDSIKKLPTSTEVKEIHCVLLTGATGYLGSNLLNQLLNITDYKIYLLVRAPTDEEAFFRVNQKFQFYFDESLEKVYGSRLFVFSSDIEKENLGVSAEDYQSLVEKIDSIIHSAALTKHYGDYEKFYSANVQATINLLELAQLTKLKDFHYISTTSILNDQQSSRDQSFFTEDDFADNLDEQPNVYVKTKHEAEKAVFRYQKQGVNANIYRVGNLAFISSNYRTQENIVDNGFFSRLKCMINLKVAAEEIGVEEISPVDLTAQAIIRLFNKQELSRNVYHVFNPILCNVVELLAEDVDLAVNLLPLSDFIDTIVERLSGSASQKLVERFLLHQGWLEEEYQPPSAVRILQDRTNFILQQLGFKWPVIQQEMFRAFVKNNLPILTRDS